MIRGVPYDAEVDWIHVSSWGAYIDTGIDARSVYGVLFEFKYSVVRNGYNSILSGALDNFTLAFGSPQGYFYLRVRGSGKGSFALDANAWHRLTIASENGAISIGGLTSSTKLPCATKEGNVTIFSNSEHSRFCDVFVRGLVLVGAGGVKLRDMVPVRIGTSCAMYDRVSRKLFRNNGSGAFSYGPDVATPVMGLHFMKDERPLADWQGMVIKWTTVSDNEEVGFWVRNPTASMSVDWGDGTVTTHAAYSAVNPITRRISHVYARAGTYFSKWDDVVTHYGHNYANSVITTALEVVKFGNAAAQIVPYAFRTWRNFTRIGNFGGVTLLNETCIQAIGNGAYRELGDMPNVVTISSSLPSGTTTVGLMPKLKTISVARLSGGSVAHMATTSFPYITSMPATAFTAFYNLEDGLDFPALTTAVNGGDGGFCRECNKMPFLRCPVLTTLAQRFVWHSVRLRTVKLGEITQVETGSYNAHFDLVGNSLAADADGFKTTIWFKNTMASLRALTNFPWSIPAASRIICRDGYITRVGGTWTDHAWDSVAALPNPGDTAYTFTVGGTDYRWREIGYAPVTA